ncbi:MAG TPA: SH3 domain-containing C40 family peptidase [Thermomicrobiales bacterium]|nr:SH3 domain-containing C40 family peptidase [Thermomicrobiales bacterium]
MVRRLRPVCAALALLVELGLGAVHAPPARAALAVGGNAVVATTEGDRLSLRQGPGLAYAVLAALDQGTPVAVVDGPATSADGATWYEVQWNGLTGWCDAEYLAAPGAAPATDTTPAAAQAAPAAAGPASMQVTGTGGLGLRLHDEPSLAAAIILSIPDGGVVAVTGATRNHDGYDWAPVQYNGLNGWVATAFLTGAVQDNSQPAASPDPAPTPPPSASPAAAASPAPTAAPAPAAGDHAAVVDTGGLDLRIRGDAGLDAPILDYAPAGAVLLVTGAPRTDSQGGIWYPINYDGSTGWVSGEHLARTDAPLSPRATGAATPPVSPSPAEQQAQPSPQPTPAPTATPVPAATPPPAPSPTPAPSPSPSPSPQPSPAAATAASPTPAAKSAADRGQAVANLALHYLGVSYLWGGATPVGWDCSGMVAYVYQQAAGVTLPRTSQQQFTVGTPVAPGDIRPGDIVFFKDTFGPGITHDGIALGGGQFVHARSEYYGTIVSNLNDPYWAAHFAGARRP